MGTPYIDIHVPSRSTPIPEAPHIDEGLARWGRAELALAIRAEGYDPIFSRGPQAYDFDRGSLATLEPLAITREDATFTVTVRPGELAIASIGAIRNISTALRHSLPELNHAAFRDLAKDKVASNDVFRAAGLSKQYAAWEKGQSLDGPFDVVTGDAVVAKPRFGMRSSGVIIGTKADVSSALEQLKEEDPEDWIIERQLATRAPLHIRGLTESDQARIDAANAAGTPKELRAYTFGEDGGELQSHYVLRVASESDKDLRNDDWVYVDQDSVPDEARDIVSHIEQSARQKLGLREVHAAIDLTPEQFIPMEINGSEPQLVFAHENPQVSAVHTRLLARQLVRVAQAAGTM